MALFSLLSFFGGFSFSTRKNAVRVLRFCIWLAPIYKKKRLHPETNFWYPPLTPQYDIFGGELNISPSRCCFRDLKILGFHPKTNSGTPPKGGIFKSFPRFRKLWIWLLRGWGRCLKVTLLTCAPKQFCWCRWGEEQPHSACTDGERGPPLVPAEWMATAKAFIVL